MLSQRNVPDLRINRKSNIFDSTRASLIEKKKKKEKEHEAKINFIHVYVVKIKAERNGRYDHSPDPITFTSTKYTFPLAGETQPWDANGTSNRARPRRKSDLNPGYTITGNDNCTVRNIDLRTSR